MEIKKESRTYILTGTTSLLGSNPANPEIHAKFVASKAESLERAASGGWATVKIGSGMSCEGGEADCVAQRKRRKDTE